ncbi:LPS-assembly protein LptD [Desulfonatronum thioautotrophicum]|uniref:LPS-assembly protein LptD n=1 Tax=Desulfonatronum thioautotrophicum TaxID=617001 RepID=UPI00069BFE23|nr:LPS assembly protein LptD [Desulfonatronum thioautotrophicum]
MTKPCPSHCCSTDSCSVIGVMARLVIAISLCCLFGLGWSTPLQAQSLFQQDFTVDPDAPWTLEADRVESHQAEQLFEAHGNVIIRQGLNWIRADTVRYFRDTGFALLDGNVRIEWDGDIMVGEQADFDLVNSVGWVTNGEIFLAQEHVYIRGEFLERQCERTFAFRGAHLTTCDGPVPAWSIRSSEGDVTTGGYARMWHPRFQVRNTPVLYSPFMIFPVKTERQSGFLIPEPSYSDRLGVGLNLPYYWAIDEEQDATFYANMMSERGLMVGAEYRHFNNLDAKGVWQADWLHDSETAPTEADEDPQFQGDGLTRANTNRYWIRGKYDGYLGNPLWRTKLDLDLVSDQNYLREFKHGYTGYTRTHDNMVRDFGRGLRNIDSVHRSNAVELSRNWTQAGFRGSLFYTQDLRYWTDNNPSSENPTLQHLPELNLDFYRTRIGSSMFELEARNQAVYFWREKGTTGARMDIIPRLSLPWTTGFGTITPSMGWRQTFYAIERHEQVPGIPDSVDESKDFSERGIPDFRVDAFTSLFSIYNLDTGQELTATVDNLGNASWSRMRHTVQPELTYSYTPSIDQDSNPFFTQDDRIGKQNLLSYSLHNIFNRRLDRVVQRPGTEGQPLTDDMTRIVTTYRDFLRVRLDQSYNFEEAQRDENLDRFERRPFSDVRMDVVFSPGQYVDLINRTWYSPYEHTITEHEHMLRGYYPGVGSAYFGFDFLAEVQDDIRRQNQRKREILRLGGLLHLPRGWHVRTDYKRDLLAREDIEKLFSVGFTHQCYFLDFIFSQTPNEDRFELRISLKGLEDFLGLGL